jgi:hypothetical protein
VVIGRTVFANIVKCAHVACDAVLTFDRSHTDIKMAMSSNFGNAFSVTIAACWCVPVSWVCVVDKLCVRRLPFLPLLPIHIVVGNLIYDLTQVSTDACASGYLSPTLHTARHSVGQRRSGDARNTRARVRASCARC